MTDIQLQTVILQELRELRAALSVHATSTAQRFDKLESQMSTLIPPVNRPVLVASKRKSRPS
jgi:hypothetical protein